MTETSLPYLDHTKSFNSRLDAERSTAKTWRVAFFSMVFLSVLLGASVYMLAINNGPIPYVAKVDEKGNVWEVRRATSKDSETLLGVTAENLILGKLTETIIPLFRELSPDIQYQRERFNKLFALSMPKATAWYDSYWHTVVNVGDKETEPNNPSIRVATETVSVSKVFCQRPGGATYTCEWLERVTSRETGMVTEKHYMMTMLVIQDLSRVLTDQMRFELANGAGIFVEEIVSFREISN